jgi:hypothetical protein
MVGRMKGSLLLDVVVRGGKTILEVLSSEIRRCWEGYTDAKDEMKGRLLM